MTIRGFMNNFSTKLTNDITNSATTFDLDSVTGISTELALCDFIPMTLDDGTNVEIIHVTGVSGSTVTVTRGQEGTSGTAFLATTVVECRATAKGISQSPRWEPIKVTTVSGTPSTVKFEGLTTGHYRIDFVQVGCSTGGDNLAVRQGTGGTPTYQTTGYYYSGIKMTYSAADAGNRAANAGQIVVIPGLGNNAAVKGQGYVEIYDIDNSASKKVISYQGYTETNAQFTRGAGSRDTAEAVTAIEFFFVSGDTFTSGTFVLSKSVH